MTEAGLLRLMTPRRLGGLESDLSTLLEADGELGRGDMSAAWVTGVLKFTAWQVGTLSTQAQDDVWGPNPKRANLFGPGLHPEFRPADGGIVATGRWPSASGSQISEWVILNVPMSFGPRGPELSAALIPMSEPTILDTWNPAGVCAPASNTLVGQDIFVPSHRLMPVRATLNGARTKHHSGDSLYSSSFAGIASIATLAPQLGLGSAILEAVTTQSQGRMVPTTGLTDRRIDRPVRIFGLPDARCRRSRSHRYRLAAREAGCRRGRRGRRHRQPAQRRQSWARQNVLGLGRGSGHGAVETLRAEAGASALMDGTALQRMWRDNATASRHTAYRLDPVRELYGRILLGKGPGSALLF